MKWMVNWFSRRGLTHREIARGRRFSIFFRGGTLFVRSKYEIREVDPVHGGDGSNYQMVGMEGS